jgi:nickel/cobalt exporter
MTAAGHVALSIVLGFAVVELGILFSLQVSQYITQGVGVIMVAGGLLYGVKQLRSSVTDDSNQETRSGPSRGEGSTGKRFRYFAVLGAALSPDLSILPIFLLAVPVGLSLALDTAIVFAAASILSLLVFLLLGAAGLAKVFEKLDPRYNDALIGFVIAAVGVYILLAG